MILAMADRDAPLEQARRPYGNSYWVEPGRLLAGEYPGGPDLALTRERLQALSDCGVRCFIDLTRPRENIEYASLLPELTGGTYVHHRFAIEDHGLPDKPEVFVAALDAIDEAHRRGQCVYIHCRAGIGRTGMLVAAYLIRRGLTNVQAFDRLQLLWQHCARSNRWPVVPETQAQIDYVHDWQEPIRAKATSVADRGRAAAVGLMVADTLSSSGTADAPIDIPTCLYADSGQFLAALESLTTAKNFDPADQLQRYQVWIKQAQADARVQVPDALKRAIASWQWSRKPFAGTHDPRNLDSHTIARTLAVVLRHRHEPYVALELSADLSRTTQQSPIVLDICRLFASLLLDAFSGTARLTLVELKGAFGLEFRARKLRPEVLALVERRLPASRSDGSALAVLIHALEALAEHKTYEAGLRHMVELKVSPSAGAVYGALAGALDGEDRIPRGWRESLPQQPRLLQTLAGLPT